MRTDIYTTELREINQKFNDLETDVEAKLNYMLIGNFATIKTRYIIHKHLLISQRFHLQNYVY
jgi:hypothetical protein